MIIKNIRADFPILRTKVYNKELVYFDNAATSQKPQAVIDALSHYYQTYNSNVHRGVHALSQKATDAYEAVRFQIKEWLNVPHLNGIIFTKGTTESINLVANSFGSAALNQEDEIVVSELEHHANLVPWQIVAQKTGAKLRFIPVLPNGTLDLADIAEIINGKTKIVAVNQVSNSFGTINPVKTIIKRARQVGAKVLIDGAQSVPHAKVDLTDLDPDFFVFSAHKACGPTGVGVLYAKPEHLEIMPPFLSGGDMIDEVFYTHSTYNVAPHKFEAGTPNIADVIAFGAAIKYLQSIGMQQIEAYEHELLIYATNKLIEIDGLTIYGNAPEKAAVISFLIEGLHPLDVGTLLDKMGIAIRTGHHCTQPLMRKFGIPGTCRASFAFYNTKEEIDYFVSSLIKVKYMLS